MKTKLTMVCLTFLALAINTSAQVVNITKALGMALKNETIIASGNKLKLIDANAYTSGSGMYYSFSFYDGSANVHSVRVDPKGKVNYSALEKNSQTRVFEDVDLSTLPAPSEVIVENAIQKAKTALETLGFKPTDSGKIQIHYHLRAEYRQKSTAVHDYKVSLPTGDGKQGKTVVFKNGNIDQVINSTIRD